MPWRLHGRRVQTLPLDSCIRKGTLSNGLTYYIRHNAQTPGQADFYIAQRVGSILEEPQQRGLAHFLEHMAFNGTRHFPDGNGGERSVRSWCERNGINLEPTSTPTRPSTRRSITSPTLR